MSLAHPSAQPGLMQPDQLNNDTPTMTQDEPKMNSFSRAINNLLI